MDTSNPEYIEVRALAFIRSHFELLNAGDSAAVRKHLQLFTRNGAPDKPITVYTDVMERMTPFRLLSASVDWASAVRQTETGIVAATVWVDVVAACSLGERSAKYGVWWIPESDECLICSYPTHWILEMLGQFP